VASDALTVCNTYQIVSNCSKLACYAAEEFRKSFLTPRWDLSYDERLKPATIPTVTPPDSFDWREHGAVTPVKNQVSLELSVLMWTAVVLFRFLLTVHLC